MRKINKGVPLDIFSQYVQKNKPKKWEDLEGELKSEIRTNILFYEQDCLCGYSEIPLEEENTSSHIDHFVKREHDQNKIFDWNNFIVSTIDEDFGGKYKDNRYKIKKEEYSQIFNPVIDDMSNYIEYLSNGKIIPKSNIENCYKEKVEKTVKVFNLNFESLKIRRKNLLHSMHNCLNQLTKEEFQQYFQNDGFISLTTWFLDEYYTE